jgi:hypothetical protein
MAMLIPLDWLRDEGYAINLNDDALNDLEIRLSMRWHESKQLELHGCLDWENDEKLDS